METKEYLYTAEEKKLLDDLWYHTRYPFGEDEEPMEGDEQVQALWDLYKQGKITPEMGDIFLGWLETSASEDDAKILDSLLGKLMNIFNMR